MAGGQAIAQGVQNFGASIGQGFQDMMKKREAKAEQLKQLAGNAKAADIGFKNNPDLFAGVDPNEWKTFSAQEKVGAFAAAVTNATLQHQRAQVDQMKALENSNREFSGFASQYAAGPSGALAPGTLDRLGVPGADAQPMSDFGLSAAMNAPQQQAPTPASPMASFQAALAQHPGAVNAPQFDNFTRAVAGLAEVPGSGPPAPPAVTKLPGGYYSYGFAGTKQRGVYPDVGSMPQPYNGNPSMYVQGRGQQLFQPRAPDRIQIPPEFNKRMDELTQDKASAQAILNDPKADVQKKARATQLLQTTHETATSLINRYHVTGYLDDASHENILRDWGGGGAAAAGSGVRRFTFDPQKGLQPVK